jgi:cytochrome c-type biogenesis protein CcmE
MNRRTFMGSALGFGLAGVALAQKTAKPGRLSGIVKSVDKGKNTIEMRGKSSSNAVRLIMYDAGTKFTMQGKPATADDVKEGLRIVAIGNFEGVNLKAAQVALTAQH